MVRATSANGPQDVHDSPLTAGLPRHYRQLRGEHEPGQLRPTRLRRNGLIARVPGRNLYQLTADGQAFAIFYTKVHDRLLRPLLATAAPQAPPPLRAALRTIDQQVNARFDEARLPAAAA